jgi:hypothetical protein
MTPLSEYLLGQMMQSMRSLESDVSEIKRKLDDILTWAQRLALLAGLWVGAIGLNLDPDKIGQIVATLVKSIR